MLFLKLMTKVRYYVILLILFSYNEAYSQINSPYSRYGFGDLVPNQPVETIIVWSEASPTHGKAPLAVTLTAEAPDGVANPSYAWTFSDGGTATGAKVSHTFSAPGVQRAMLKVTSPKGDLGLDEQRIKVE